MGRVARACLTAALSLAVALNLAAGEAAGDAEADLRRFLVEVSSMEADFHQTLVDPDGAVAQATSGRLYILRPLRFRWEYQEPGEQLVVSDGERMWLYDVDLEQVTVRKLDGSLQRTPAALLSGDTDFDEAFVVKGQWEEGDTRWVELAPKQDSGDFQSMRVAFRDGRLVAMDLTDNLDQQTRIEFGASVRNPELDAELFTFTPPEGVDVISEDEF